MDAFFQMVPPRDRHKRIASFPTSICGVCCYPCWSPPSFIVLLCSFRHFMVSYAWDWQLVVTYSFQRPTSNYLQLLQVHNFQHSLVLLLVFCCFFRRFFGCCILNFLFVWQLFQIVICYCLEFILLPCLGNVRLPHVPPAPPPTLPPTIEGRWSACAEIIHTRDLQSHNLIPYLLG